MPTVANCSWEQADIRLPFLDGATDLSLRNALYSSAVSDSRLGFLQFNCRHYHDLLFRRWLPLSQRFICLNNILISPSTLCFYVDANVTRLGATPILQSVSAASQTLRKPQCGRDIDLTVIFKSGRILSSSFRCVILHPHISNMRLIQLSISIPLLCRTD